MSPRRGRDPWRMAFFVLLVLAVLAAAGWVLLGPNLLVVRREEVTGNRLVPSAEVLAAAGIRRGTPLVEVNLSAAAHRIERITQVLSATVTRSWPDTVDIRVTERTPELAVAGDGGYALIDGHGVTVRFSRQRPAGMPLLTSPPSPLRGSVGVQAAAQVLVRMPRVLRSMVESVSAPAANEVTFALQGGITVVWGGPARTAAKVAELLVLLRTHARYYDVSDPTTPVTQS